MPAAQITDLNPISIKKAFVDVVLVDGQSWQERRAELEQELDGIVTCSFVVELGREALLTPTSAEFVIRFDGDQHETQAICDRYFFKVV